MALVDVSGLSVEYRSRDYPTVHAVRGVDLSIGHGECVALLGESGCGKSTLGTAILQLLEKPAVQTAGSISFDGVDLSTLQERELADLRWQRISTVFQSSMNALNPVMTVRAQFVDVMAAHGISAHSTDAHERIDAMLEAVGLDARRVARAYPHELSGGMRQRVVLALSLVMEPDFVVLDEPTTGLDVVIQRTIVDKLLQLRDSMGFSMLFISHDLGTAAEIADRVVVMYAGQVVEEVAASDVTRAHHPYTRGLLGSFADPRWPDVRVGYVPGRPPALVEDEPGCAFAPRCPRRVELCSLLDPELTVLSGRSEVDVADAALDAGRSAVVTAGAGSGDGTSDGASPKDMHELTEQARCHLVAPPSLDDLRGAAPVVPAERIEDLHAEVMVASQGHELGAMHAANLARPGVVREPILVATCLVKEFVRRSGLHHERVMAVRDFSLSLAPGQVVALVGQSGSGKSTVAKMLTAVERPDSGTIEFAGQHVERLGRKETKGYRTKIQMVFQDPFAALNPTSSIGYALSRPLINRGVPRKHVPQEIADALSTVGLPADMAQRLPHQLSGGQRQRVVIARAMATRPQVLVADEPISMLDVSIRAEILELLASLVATRDIAMLYITHDLLSARLLSDEILVMREGEIVESGTTEDVVAHPSHEYTKLLLDSVPQPFDRPLELVN